MYDAVGYLPELARGIAQLERSQVVLKSLRMAHSPHQLLLRDGRSLFDAFRECGRHGWREESQYLMSLSARVPIGVGLRGHVRDRMQLSEMPGLRREEGEVLLVCALCEWISVSLPCESLWDSDTLTIDFLELLSDDSFVRVSNSVDNIARSEHAKLIIMRVRLQLQIACSDAASLWEQRTAMFPHLVLGPDVRKDLSALNPGLIGTVINRLAELDRTANDWTEQKDSSPPWRCKVTPESRSVMDHPQKASTRHFRSVHGGRRSFYWHARFGSGGRIHIRFDQETFEIEVGYIGMHLPL